MPNYIPAALHKYNHPAPMRPQHAPSPWTRPNYGAKQQMAPPPANSPRLGPMGIKRVQQITGTLLFYSRAVNSTLLVAIGSISAQQSKATQQTEMELNQLLDYCHTHPTATICYTASDMVLHLHSDAAFQSEAKARSRAGEHFYLGNKTDNQPETLNGALLSTSTIMKHVMSSAAEAECGALFLNATHAIPLRISLEEMGHPQPPTPIQVDNSTTAGFANRQIKQRQSRSMDMRFYWIQDRADQKQIRVFGGQGPPTWPTITQNTTRHPTIRMCDTNMCTSATLHISSARVC